MPMNSDSGFHSEILFMDELANPQTVADYENFIARLVDVPRYFDENIANMRDGMRDGFTLPAAILDGVSKGIAGEQYDDPEKMPLWRPFAKFPHAVPESERARLAAAGKAALAGAVIPAYAAFQRFFETEYRAGGADDHRRLGAPGGPRLLRRPRPLFHDASRCDAGRHPRDRRCARSRAFARRWKRSCAS